MLVLETVESERRDVLSDRQAMLEAFDHLGPIEQRIVCVLVQRIGMGQGQYGPFRDNDPRHEPDEMIEEVTDALVYAGKRLVKMARKYAAAPQRDTQPCDPVIEVECDPDWEKDNEQ